MVKLIWKVRGREVSVMLKMVFNKGEVDEICTLGLYLSHMGKVLK